MKDLRFRTERVRRYIEMVPPGLSEAKREEVAGLAQRLDEDGLIAFLEGQGPGEEARRKMALLARAREIAERVNEFDRTLPILPHIEITRAYNELRRIRNELDTLTISSLSSEVS